MKKSILELEGVQKLSKDQLKSINGQGVCSPGSPWREMLGSLCNIR
jgi:hypothetical protein